MKFQFLLLAQFIVSTQLPFPSTYGGGCVVHDKVLYYIGGAHDRTEVSNRAIYSLPFTKGFQSSSPPWSVKLYSETTNLQFPTNVILNGDLALTQSQDGSILNYNIKDNSWNKLSNKPTTTKIDESVSSWTRYKDIIIQITSGDKIKIDFLNINTFEPIQNSLNYTLPKFQEHTAILHKDSIFIITPIKIYRYSLIEYKWYKLNTLNDKLPNLKGFSTIKLNDTHVLLAGGVINKPNDNKGGYLFDLDSFKWTWIPLENFDSTRLGCLQLINDNTIVYVLGEASPKVQLIDLKTLSVVEEFFEDTSYQKRILLVVLLSLLGIVVIFCIILIIYRIRNKKYFSVVDPITEPIWADDCALNKYTANQAKCPLTGEPINLDFDHLDAGHEGENDDIGFTSKRVTKSNLDEFASNTMDPNTKIKSNLYGSTAIHPPQTELDNNPKKKSLSLED